MAATGDEVTISGSGFDPSSSGDVVTINRSRGEVVSASETSLKVAVPEATLGGHVSVAAANGSDTGPDLYIPPNKVVASKVGATGRFSIGEPMTTELSKAGTIGLKLFDGTPGEKIAFTLSEATFSGNVSIWGPKDTKLSGSEASFTESGGGIVEPVILPEMGTYTVRIEGSGEQAGSVKLTSSIVEDIASSITPTKEGTEGSV